MKKDKVQAGLARRPSARLQEGLPVYSVSADVQGFHGHQHLPEELSRIAGSKWALPRRTWSASAPGLAKVGFIPIVDTFGQFGVTKGNLPLTMAALSQAPVIAIFSHVGFQDAADGASHQATTYLAAT